MSYTNTPSAENPSTPQPPKDNRKIIYGVLIAALLATWGYVIYDKNKSAETITQLETGSAKVTTERDSIQTEFNKQEAKLDSLTGTNTKLQGDLAQRKADIDKLKEEIRHKLANKDTKISELNSLVAQLKGQVSDLFGQIEQLKAQNQQLTNDNHTLTTQRDSISTAKKVVEDTLASTQSAKAHLEDVGSTLHASNINIEGIEVKSNGKEKETTKAKRADLFRISFTLDQNYVAQSGSKDLYVCVTAPDGKPVTMPGTSGTFNSREEGAKTYTIIKNVNYEQGKPAPVSFDWKPDGGKYAVGDYKIQIYQNGYKIGEATKTLKKAGFLG
jgi:peptidoglycan hydrolase CwlO-like protein